MALKRWFGLGAAPLDAPSVPELVTPVTPVTRDVMYAGMVNAYQKARDRAAFARDKRVTSHETTRDTPATKPIPKRETRFIGPEGRITRGKDGIYHCPHCDYVTDDPANLRQHRHRRHHP